MAKMTVHEDITGMKEDTISVLDAFNMDDIHSSGASIRIGNKLVKLVVSEEQPLVEDEIREDLKQKLNIQLQRIRDVLNEKVAKMSEMASRATEEAEKREEEANRKLREANIMPDIQYRHAKRGLSVIKGHPGYSDEQDVYTWLYQGVFWPKYCDGYVIEPKFSKKLITPVTIEIITVRNKIRNVTVREVIGLKKFLHYHSMSGDSDCWGDWKWNATWKTVDDILAVGEQSCAVLEKINTESPGNRTPRGLPRLETISRHLSSDKKVSTGRELSKEDMRMGIMPDGDERQRPSSSVWST